MPRPYPEDIHLIGVPLDLGAGRRGVDMGPSAIRIAGVRERLERLGYRVTDAGDVPVPDPGVRRSGRPDARTTSRTSCR